MNGGIQARRLEHTYRAGFGPRQDRAGRGPLAVGDTGIATIAGGAGGGFFTLWLAAGPGYLPVPPFGVVLLDLQAAGAWTSGALDAGGAATVPVAVPDLPALAGAEFTFQAFAALLLPPGGSVSNAATRRIAGPPPR